jgi:nucleotide-binding universal stress UspA family protein
MTAAIGSILCPTDFSPSSVRALEHAVPLALFHHAPLTALHVVPPWPTEVLLSAGFAALPPSTMDEGAIREQVEAFLEPARQAGVRVDARVAQGAIVPETLRVLEEMEDPLVALGTHGRGPIERLVLGSVTEKLMRKAVGPVLTVGPAGDASPARPRFDHLLCAVEFSAASLRALAMAFDLARESRGQLTLLHVMEDGDREEDARAWLENAVPPGARQACQPRLQLGRGSPWREIVNVAAALACDLVVMGPHGREPIDRTFFGSTTSHVVRQAGCAVLTVRELG